MAAVLERGRAILLQVHALFPGFCSVFVGRVWEDADCVICIWGCAVAGLARSGLFVGRGHCCRTVESQVCTRPGAWAVVLWVGTDEWENRQADKAHGKPAK